MQNQVPYLLTETVAAKDVEVLATLNLLERLSPRLKFSVVATAYLDALSILEEKGTCSEFFGGSEAATLVLNELITKLEESSIKEQDVAIRMFGEVTIVQNLRLNLSYRMFEKAFINTMGPFYRLGNGLRTVGRFRSSTREARALMLLHELAHLMRNASGDWLIPNDGKGSPAGLTLRNSKIIEAACRTPLAALKRKPHLNLRKLAVTGQSEAGG